MAMRLHVWEENGLDQVSVRLLRPEERGRFDELLQARHYLRSARLAGQSLRYVAHIGGEWVALAAFSAPALRMQARERWIGWSNGQRARRLIFLANNSRFLVLGEPSDHLNLGSRVLSLCLKRLSADWQEQWEHPVLLLESFVDERQYPGTCYQGSGFEAVGWTSGFGRSSRGFYVEHGHAKRIYLRELVPGAAALLRQGRLPDELAHYERSPSGPCVLKVADLRSLLEAFEVLGDRRRGHGLKHRQPFVLACATVAMLMGAGAYQTFQDKCRAHLSQAQLRALGCRYDRKSKAYAPPSDTTFFRVFKQVDPARFDLAVGRWISQQDISVLESLAEDYGLFTGDGEDAGDDRIQQLLWRLLGRLRVRLVVAANGNEIGAMNSSYAGFEEALDA